MNECHEIVCKTYSYTNETDNISVERTTRSFVKIHPYSIENKNRNRNNALLDLYEEDSNKCYDNITCTPVIHKGMSCNPCIAHHTMRN